jgi:hypothetical protein
MSGTSYQDLLRHIMTQPLDIRPLQIHNVSRSGIQILQSMLNIFPDQRASITKVNYSSWLIDVDSEPSVEGIEVDMIDDGSC